MPTVEELVKQLSSDDKVQVYKGRMALTKLEDEAGAPGREADRKQLAANLARLIDETHDVPDPKKPKEKPKKEPKHSVAVRNRLIRGLATVGGDAEIATLKRALEDFEVREMARWSLDRMTVASATQALADAATKSVGTEFRVGAINALGRKPSSPVVVDALNACLDDRDGEVRLAAIEALSNHVDGSQDEVLVAAAKKFAKKRSRGATRLARARVRMAERLAQSGQQEAARKIYRSLAADGVDSAQKQAAEKALKRPG